MLNMFLFYYVFWGKRPNGTYDRKNVYFFMYQCVTSGYFHEYKRFGYSICSCTFKRHCYHLCNVSFISNRNRKVVFYKFSPAVNYRKCFRFYIAIWRSVGRKICEYCIYSDNYMYYMDLFSVAWKKNRQRCISSAGKNEFCCSLCVVCNRGDDFIFYLYDNRGYTC